MIGRLFLGLGVILIIVAVLKFLGIVAIASAAAGTLLVVGIVLVVIAYALVNGWSSRYGNRNL